MLPINLWLNFDKTFRALTTFQKYITYFHRMNL